jgi:hypothetical protein
MENHPLSSRPFVNYYSIDYHYLTDSYFVQYNEFECVHVMQREMKNSERMENRVEIFFISFTVIKKI